MAQFRVNIFELREQPVSPFDGPGVVIADTGEDSLFADIVFRLCHIVEPGIVHDTGGVPMFLHPFLVAQLLYRRGAGRTEVVAEAQCMAHFMARYKPDQLSHQFIAEVQPLCSFVVGRRLDEVPVAHQPHHVVVPVDVAFHNFARAGVGNAGPTRIRYR